MFSDISKVSFLVLMVVPLACRAMPSFSFPFRSRIQVRDALPWQHKLDWKPPYGGLHNNLPRLLKLMQERDKWITLYVITDSVLHDPNAVAMLKNSITSLVVYGSTPHYIVGAVTPSALTACMTLKLPCWNATMVNHRLRPIFDTYKHSTAEYVYACWAKMLATSYLLNSTNINVHYSDADIVYLKPVYPSIRALFWATQWQAQISSMKEECMRRYPPCDYLINAGLVFARNTPLVRSLYGAWEALMSPNMPPWYTDQEGLANLFAQHYLLCNSPISCQIVAQKGLVPVARHNTPWLRQDHCPPLTSEERIDGDTLDHCSVPHRLYIHAVCTKDKVRLFKHLGLWLVDMEEYPPPCAGNLNFARLWVT